MWLSQAGTLLVLTAIVLLVSPAIVLLLSLVSPTLVLLLSLVLSLSVSVSLVASGSEFLAF
jgi:hypothetical protein